MSTKRFICLVCGLFLALFWAVTAGSTSPPVANSALLFTPTPAPTLTPPTPTSCPNSYNYTVSALSIVSSTALLPGSQCGICILNLPFPFPITFYGQTYTSANVSTQGNLQFTTSYLGANTCPLPEPLLGPAMMPHWDEWLETAYPYPCLAAMGTPCGIYTSVLGVAPNRIFKIEWRARFISTSQHTANFEIRLFENSTYFEYVYGWVSYTGGGASIGVQDGGCRFTTYSCNTWYNIQTGTRIGWGGTGGTPTPTPTACIGPITVSGSINTGNPQQLGQIIRDNIPSSCENPQPCMGVGGQTTPYHYNAHTFTNTLPYAACFTVSINAMSCTGNNSIFSAAYLNTFEPLAQCNNYLADIGPSPSPIGSYSFTVPAGANFIVVVHETRHAAGCPYYVMNVYSAGCTPTPTPTTQPTITPTIGPPCGILTFGNPGTTYCTSPTSYFYSFTFYVESGCPSSMNGTATVTYEVAPDQSGPWTAYDTQTYPVTFQRGWNGSTGTFQEPGLPSQYQWYRVEYISRFPNNVTAYSVTNPAQRCDMGTVTPTTSTPPATPETTHTATGTPVSCNISFIDVPPDNTFYPHVRCLVCRGIVSGYADRTFRPNNPVTRGQLAKMVSNAAGFSEPVSGQTFQDVPPTHIFYEFIQRLTARGYMTGYLCGGAGEPCVNNRPYFRPQSNATRGQTSKIVANAAGFTEPPAGQTFEDVPLTHTFYEFIQRLATRNVMSGYPCGGHGEPCVTGNPYFRPGNDVTRGQSAKIVANTFYPDCEMRRSR